MREKTVTEAHIDFSEYLDRRRLFVEQRLIGYLIATDPDILWQSMRYSVLSGGKRLRAILCLSAAEAVAEAAAVPPKENEVFETVMPCACAIEMVHASSLIHDDLPALDNDDYRRGKLANHKVFGEAVALLAGNALLLYANEVILTKTPSSVDPSVIAALVTELARACGPMGMVGGQVDDLAFTGSVDAVKSSSDNDGDLLLERIHCRKTGALIRFSLWSGAKLMGAALSELDVLEKFANTLGLAFQIADDLLDVTGDIKSLGKTPGKDVQAKKVTWVTVYGSERSRRRLKELENDGLALLDNGVFDPAATTHLKSLLQYAIHRSS